MTSRNVSNIALGGEPRVNLLPPEVALRKKARGVRRGLIALVIAVVVLVAGGYAFAAFRSIEAQAGLAVAQQRTQGLLTDQLKYTDVTLVTGNVQAVKDARTVGTSTEVAWNDYYVKIRDILPVGAALETFTVDGRAPWEPEFLPAGPLREPRAATITFVLVANAPIDYQAFAKKLAAIDGFADASPDVLEQNGAYKATFTLTLNTDALSGRFPAGQAGNN